jgi:hypothetical protein
VTRLGAELQRIAGLNGDALAVAWGEVFGETLPDVAPSLLRRALAHERQERSLGGLPAVALRRLEALAAGGAGTGADLPLRLKPGTRLMREWNGTVYSVLVGPEGFEFAGRTWASLSSIARHITAAHWSGPRFFGLRSKRR